MDKEQVKDMLEILTGAVGVSGMNENRLNNGRLPGTLCYAPAPGFLWKCDRF